MKVKMSNGKTVTVSVTRNDYIVIDGVRASQQKVTPIQMPTLTPEYEGDTAIMGVIQKHLNRHWRMV